MDQFKRNSVQSPDRVWIVTYLHPNCIHTKEELIIWVSRSSTFFFTNKGNST